MGTKASIKVQIVSNELPSTILSIDVFIGCQLHNWNQTINSESPQSKFVSVERTEATFRRAAQNLGRLSPSID
jgi:hypothetical protein